ncbi:hypothetical protein LC593_36615 [Nostoc sp. CHAB 5844]|nr:hypothetical protein [Nostoc sp. CHAB 5844]
MRSLLLSLLLVITSAVQISHAQDSSDPVFMEGKYELDKSRMYLMRYHCEVENLQNYLSTFPYPRPRSAMHFFSIKASGNPERITEENILNGGYAGAQHVFTINNGTPIGQVCSGMMLVRGKEKPTISYHLRTDTRTIPEQIVQILTFLDNAISPAYRIIRSKTMHENDSQAFSSAKTISEKYKEFSSFFTSDLSPGGNTKYIKAGNNNLITRASLVNISLEKIDGSLIESRNSEFIKENIDDLISLNLDFEDGKIEESCKEAQDSLFSFGIKANIDQAFVISRRMPYVEKKQIIECLGINRLVDTTIENKSRFRGYIPPNKIITKIDVDNYKYEMNIASRDAKLMHTMKYFLKSLSDSARDGGFSKEHQKNIGEFIKDTITVRDMTMDDLITKKTQNLIETERETSGPWQEQLGRLAMGGFQKYGCVLATRSHSSIQSYDEAVGIILARRPATDKTKEAVVSIRLIQKEGRFTEVNVTDEFVVDVRRAHGDCGL